MRGKVLLGVVGMALVLGGFPLSRPAPAQKAERPPHGQDRVPGPALSPAEAMRKMTVPPGFQVELVAAEPDIVNPVAMTFDERGRIWITESLEYPRSAAGPGRDRVKVLEDTDGDGKADRFTIFAEGLNIPSGIAVGHGGVWVANAPDILFLQDTDGDGKADRREVVVTGFGRTDTHELPNSLTWGPDGWLYGLNGVFNHSHVTYRGKEYTFTCALFRIHPRTRDFELFCEGTSNPWGIAFDREGSAFVSACVIDHLWHLTETGYYHRQGGPYPPFTWKIGSIVQHKHQKAAYCGLHYFDSDAYPPEYRERLYMGNIHGNCINADILERDGSTYLARPAPDFLSAHDPWFMPVVQKTGPDGCLYILDWYDRYHCYQDARRDPEGIDRLRGRLYRVRYGTTPRAPRFDLARESDSQLVERLQSPNIYFRDLAQRLLAERNTPAARQLLHQLVLAEQTPRKARLHALWALVGMGPLDARLHQQLLDHADAGVRAWAVRAAGNQGKVDAAVRDRVLALVADPSPDVQLQVVIAARKLAGVDPLPVLLQALARCGKDRLIPHIVWQNLHPLLEDRAEEFIALLDKQGTRRSPHLKEILPRAVERLLATREAAAGHVVTLFTRLSTGPSADPETARHCLVALTSKVQNREIPGPQLEVLRKRLRPVLANLLAGPAGTPLHTEAVCLGATLRDPAALQAARTFLETGPSDEVRLKAFDALLTGGDPRLLDTAATLLADRQRGSVPFRAQVLASLGRLEDPRVAGVVLAHYEHMEPELQPRAVELLTQRTPWSKELLRAIAAKKVPHLALNVNHVRKLLTSKDPELVKQVKAQWGTIREGRNPEREQIVAQMRELLARTRGDAQAGRAVFKNVCGQCHKLHGEGQEVGPDLTGVGRASLDQLLSNVFDPSLVIGASYQATTVVTTQGRVLTGLVVENSPQRIVLKTQGEKLETIPRGEIEEVVLSTVSLMPEGFEKQLKPQDVADLFAYLLQEPPVR